MIDFYVINLEKRTDRWNNIIKNFTDPDYNLIRVNAVETKRGWQGCFQSHVKCIQIAKEKGLKYIIVVEDDCEPINKGNNVFKSRLNTILEYLESSSDWYIYLGATVSIQPYTYKNIIRYKDETFVNFTKAFTTHFTIYNEKSYDFFLNVKQDKPIDEVWYGHFNCLVSVPFIAKQIEGYSDIIGRNKSDDVRLQTAEKLMLTYIKSN